VTVLNAWFVGSSGRPHETLGVTVITYGVLIVTTATRSPVGVRLGVPTVTKGSSRTRSR